MKFTYSLELWMGINDLLSLTRAFDSAHYFAKWAYGSSHHQNSPFYSLKTAEQKCCYFFIIPGLGRSQANYLTVLLFLCSSLKKNKGKEKKKCCRYGMGRKEWREERKILKEKTKAGRECKLMGS